MTRMPKTIGAEALGGQALAFMERHKITALVVIDEASRKPVGVIHLHDLLRAGIV
jgi:arabinose-5-phosphate isomerase